MENLLLDSIAEKLTMIEDKIAKTESLAISTNDSMKEVKEILNFMKRDHKSIRTAIEYMPPPADSVSNADLFNGSGGYR